MSALSFRRQFQRVRQNIDQNLGRAEKTEVLTEDELNVERRVELIKNICQNLQKKLLPCLRSLGQNSDLEKRMKKLPESGLSHTMIECSVQLDQNSIPGKVFSLAGDAQGKLAQEILKLEVDMENKILKTLHNMLENEYPSVQKLRKQLNSKTLDMDAAKSRYQSVVKQMQSGAVPQSKVDEVRNEMDDAVTRVEQIKDQLATEMYNFSAKETDLCQSLLELVQAQADYHRRSLELLDGYTPQLINYLSMPSQKPVFGLNLEEHLLGKPGEIALVIEECVQFLCLNGIEEEGLFRIAGAASKIKKLKSAYNSNVWCGPILGSEDYDVHTAASVLKQYLRELPEPLMKSDLYADWMKALEKPQDQVVSSMKEVAEKLEPREYYKNLRYLIKFLRKLSDSSDINKMTPANIGLVMGPNLIWPPGDPGVNMLTTGLQSSLVEILINNVDAIFPGASEIDIMDTTYSPSFKIQTNMLQATGYPDLGSGSKYQAPVGTTECKGNNPDLILPAQSATSTLRKTKKQPAPQPPLPEAVILPQLYPNHPATQDYPPSPRLEKPRVPPPERPNMPPPDKPPVAERPKVAPPPVSHLPPLTGIFQTVQPSNSQPQHSNSSLSSSLSHPLQPAPTPPQQLPYPYQPQPLSQPLNLPYPPQLQIQPYPYQPQPAISQYPYQPQPQPANPSYPYQPQPANPPYPYQPQPAIPPYPYQSQPANPPYQPQPQPSSQQPINTQCPYPLPSEGDNLSLGSIDQMSTSMSGTSVRSSSMKASSNLSSSSPVPSPGSPFANSSTSRICHSLEQPERSDNSSPNPAAVKGHSRQHSTGSKHLPPRPHPPVPPKKVEMKSSDF